MFRIFLLLSFCFFSLGVLSQDLPYARKTINSLTSKKYWGRGYTQNGMEKAADFIEKEFKRFGLSPIGNQDFKQYFTFPVNTFPGKMRVEIDGKKLVPGRDFIVHQASKGIIAHDSLLRKDSITYIAKNNALILSLKPKLTWSAAQNVMDYTLIEVRQKAIPSTPTQIHIAIENEFIPNFKAANVAGIVRGTSQPDSVIVFSAHYDHLGGMGNETYFPGANDNASGVALLLNLAKYYAANPPKYSIAFICFAAEEIGLLGSKYYTENPLSPLANIRLLWNLDLVGTGEAGATVVNATIHPNEFALLNAINREHQLLPKINPRGKAANSDHYFFTEKGVLAFFLYTQGGITAYHDVDDKASTLPLTAYENLFRLFVYFNAVLMK